MRLSRRAFCACLLCGLGPARALADTAAAPAAAGAAATQGADAVGPSGATNPATAASPNTTLPNAGPPSATTPTLVPLKAGTLIEPKLHVPKGGNPGPRVALTLDACSGATDHRILDVLLAENIPATIFATGRWIRRNPQALAIMAARPDLFEIENHGLNHVPAIERPGTVYGIATAGSMQAVESEVEEGARWIVKAGLARPRWFRGATARYTPASVMAIEALGFRIAGYSLNADDGASVAARTAARRIAAAHDGDVVIAHVNQPTHAAGQGVADGLLALKKRGAAFVRLGEIEALDQAAADRQG